MYLQYRDLKLIQTSGRPDKDNEDILDGKCDNSGTPLSYEERIAKIFSDWQQGDILVIADQPLKHPKIQGGTLVEMTREEVCESGDLSVLNDGEVWENNEIKVIPKLDGLKIEWIYPNWVETASSEEKKEKYYSLINEYKSEILDTGYTYVDIEGKEHQQKCRDKDLALLGNCISAHEDIATFSSEELKTAWAFNDGDILELNLSELKKLRLQGAMFVQTVFNVEAILKGLDSNIKLTKNDFIELINENSNVKCWSY